MGLFGLFLFLFLLDLWHLNTLWRLLTNGRKVDSVWTDLETEILVLVPIGLILPIGY